MPSSQMNNSNPSEDIAAVTPSDSTNLPAQARAIYAGSGGDITLDINNTTQVLFKAVPAGGILPVRATRIRATGTTATNIVALF